MSFIKYIYHCTLDSIPPLATANASRSAKRLRERGGVVNGEVNEKKPRRPMMDVLQGRKSQEV
jgi:hypothetical protein